MGVALRTIERILVVTGFGFAILLELLYTWGGWVFESSTFVDLQQLLLVWSTPHGITNALVFLLVALFGHRLSSRQMLGVLPVAAFLVIAGHMLLLNLSNLPNPVFLITVAAVLIGSGTSLALVGWVNIFSRLTANEGHVLILSSLAVFAVLFTALSLLSPAVLAFVPPVLVVATVVLAFALYRLEPGKAEGASSEATPQNAALPRHPLVKVVIELRSPLFCAASIGFAVPFTRVSALTEPIDIVFMNGVFAVVMIVVAVLLFLLRYGPGRNSDIFRSFDIPRLFKFTLPLVATALLLYSFFGSPLALPMSVAVFVLYYLVWLLIIPTCVIAASKLKLSPLLCYGVAACIMNLVYAGATWLSAVMLAGELYFGTATLSVCMLLVLYVLMMTFTFQGQRSRRAHAGDAPANAKAQDACANAKGPDAPAGVAHNKHLDPARSTRTLCEDLAQTHQLTPREYDILLLLAQGRDTPYIANQLFISKNTVRTHIKNVYVKIDVHSRQELLDLLEHLRS